LQSGQPLRLDAHSQFCFLHCAIPSYGK
jgi:hypothetical protein